jgi:hypothetical protein
MLYKLYVNVLVGTMNIYALFINRWLVHDAFLEAAIAAVVFVAVSNVAVGEPLVL